MIYGHYSSMYARQVVLPLIFEIEVFMMINNP